MIKDVALGQYFPGNSIIHRLDPRIKIVLTIAYIVALFICKGIIPYTVMAVFLLTVIFITKINIRLIFKSLRPILILLAFTAILNVFYTKSGTELLRFGTVSVTTGGIATALYMTVRIILLVTGTFVMLTYTTSPIMLTDGLEALLSPLKKIKFPVHELSMMMSIALRFIPTLIEETDKIMSAQKSRGASFDTGNLVSRARALVPILVPLFINAFKRAEDLALAMECRCYHGGEGRVRMRVFKLSSLDIYACILSLAIFTATTVISSVVTLGAVL
ncbi:MAG: energy-coupling factor transporter transmembrane protein EcfT [Oscillospiraceae bacterium]|nr:energy-coupling factor transporter transmembrane protein EcfT [Oscillospiraceae bacterium]